LEATAEDHNDLLLILDELSQLEPRAAGESAYLLANGTGKARALRTGDGRPVKRWRLLFLSSGEIGLEEHMQAAGKKVRAGQQIRMVEIPSDAGKAHGIFEDLYGFPNGAAFADHITARAAEYYGTAFPAFVEWLIRERPNLRELVENLRGQFVADVLATAAG